MNETYETTMNPASDSNPAQADVFPDFAISLDEAGRRVRMLLEFVRDHMVEGEDYGVIPGTSGKPTLFKAGAEKMNAIFGLAPIVEITNRVEDWDKGFVSYEVKVTLLNKRSAGIEAEGVGLCNSRERKYKNQDAANVANTVMKMAHKRALIAATLLATRASGLFTQDLEDLDIERDGGAPRSAAERFAPRESAPRDNAPREYSRNSGENNADGEAGGTPPANALTDAQRSAILAISSKLFGRNVKDEMAKLVNKPISQLTKSEASALIDQLRSMMPEQPTHREPAREYSASYNGDASR